MTEHNTAPDLMTSFEAAAAALAQSLADVADKRVADHDARLSALEAEARDLAATIEETREAAAAHHAAARDLAIVEDRLDTKRRTLREETEKQARLADPNNRHKLKQCAPSHVAAVQKGNAAAIERCDKAIAELEPSIAALRQRVESTAASAERCAAAGAKLVSTQAAIGAERDGRRRALALRSDVSQTVERNVGFIRKKAQRLCGAEI